MNIHGDEHQSFPAGVQELFRAYSAAIPEVEAGANFMPELWARIDGRRQVTIRFRRLATAFVTAAFLICIVISGAFYNVLGSGDLAHNDSSTYVDVLADTDETFDFQLVSVEPPASELL